jgi:hypothetical protein
MLYWTKYTQKRKKYFFGIFVSDITILDLFNNPVGCFTSLAISRPLGYEIAVFQRLLFKN